MCMKKFINWIYEFLRGIAIGIACIIPGVSGGTIAIITKCYDRIINSVGDIFKHFVKSFLTLLPIFLGCGLAILGAWIPLHLAFENFMFAIVCLFAGLIVGGIGTIAEEIQGKKTNAKLIIVAIIAFVVAVMFGVTSVLIDKFGGGYNVQEAFDNPQWWLYLMLIPVGIIASFALIVPGISGSMMLLVMGVYTPILALPSKISDGTISIGSAIGLLGCLALGVLIGFFLFSKLMAWLLSKHRLISFYAILGFVVGSIPALFVNKDIWSYYENHGVPTWEIYVGLLLLLVGFIVTFLLTRKMKNTKATVDNESETVK